MRVRDGERYLKELYLTKGYIYLVEIYELFGFRWHPRMNNLVLCADNYDNFTIDVDHSSTNEKCLVVNMALDVI